MSDSDDEDVSWNQDRFPAWNSDSEALNAAKTEAQRSLNQTITSIQNIDDTAVSLFRINLVLISLVLTGVSSFSASLRFANLVSIIGFGFLVLSSFAAVITNMGSDYPTGISGDHLRELQDAAWTEVEWNEWMIREYQAWLADANQMAEGDARALFITQVLLGGGILLLIIGVVVGLFGLMDPLPSIQPVNNSSVPARGAVLYAVSN